MCTSFSTNCKAYDKPRAHGRHGKKGCFAGSFHESRESLPRSRSTCRPVGRIQADRIHELEEHARPFHTHSHLSRQAPFTLSSRIPPWEHKVVKASKRVATFAILKAYRSNAANASKSARSLDDGAPPPAS